MECEVTFGVQRSKCDVRRVSCEVWSVEEGVKMRSLKCGLLRVRCEWVKCPRVRCLCVKRVQVKKCKQKIVWSKHVGKNYMVENFKKINISLKDV